LQKKIVGESVEQGLSRHKPGLGTEISTTHIQDGEHPKVLLSSRSGVEEPGGGKGEEEESSGGQGCAQPAETRASRKNGALGDRGLSDNPKREFGRGFWAEPLKGSHQPGLGSARGTPLEVRENLIPKPLGELAHLAQKWEPLLSGCTGPERAAFPIRFHHSTTP
jgi:hypothetical protein